MTRGFDDSVDVADRLGAALVASIEAVDRGDADTETVIGRYPEFAAELRDFFAAQERTKVMAAPLSALILAARPAKVSEIASAPPNPLGDYRILRELGRGGMGIVYEAEQLSLGRRVALKVLPFAATMDSRHLHRFQNEARAAASLEHPHIVPVYAVGCERGVHFYAMKLIEGESLAGLIEKQRESSSQPASADSAAPAESTVVAAGARTERSPRDAAAFRQIATWGMQAALALEHAHGVGIVHRDIKPANLMIDRFGVLWVTDFGLARTAADAGLTTTGNVLGTLRYMSPEQAQARHGLVDHRTDIYSLGVTLYELLTRRPAIQGKDREQILNAIALEEPRLPRELDPAIPRDLETILLKMLEKNPADRYVTAKDVAEDLERYRGDEPIRARRPSYPQRFRRWFRRHQAAMIAAAMTLALSLVVGAVLILLERDRTVAALRDAQVQRTDAEEQAARARRFLYVAEMKLAHDAWLNTDLRMLRELLARQVPEAGQEDLRGIEWHYLMRQAHGKSLTLAGHTSEVNHVAFSRDGKWLATASQDKTVRLWEVATGRPVRTFTGHTGDVNWVSISPDGKTLASAAEDATIRLWDLASGQQLSALPGHAGEVVVAEFSPDGKIIASGGIDKQVRLWDAATGQLRATLEGHTGRVESLAFTPDSRTLVSGDRVGSIFVWDALAWLRGDPVSPSSRRLLAANPNGVLSVAMSPDGLTVVTGDLGARAKQWDLATGRLKDEKLHRVWVEAVAFSPDGKTLATGCNDSAVRLYDLSTGEVRVAFGHSGWVWSVAFSPDGNTIASAGADGVVQLWKVAGIYQRQLLLEQSSQVQTIAYSPDGCTLATNSAAGGASLWDARTGQLRLDSSEGSATGPAATGPRRSDAPSSWSSLAFSPDGTRLLISNWRQHKTDVWDLSQGRKLEKLPPWSGDMLALSPDGSTLATGPLGWDVQLWKTITGNPSLRLAPNKGMNSPMRLFSMSFSPDGQILALGWSLEIMIWDLATGRLSELPNQTTHCLAFSPDGRALVTGAINVLKVRDPRTGEERKTMLGIPPGQGILSIVFSPDGKTLATSSSDKTIRLWNMPTQQELFTLSNFTELEGPVPLAFSPDGTTLAAAVDSGNKSKVFLWSTRNEPD